MKLPILLSVPHAGVDVPDEAKAYCTLTRDDIVRDGDEGADEIYDLRSLVAAFQTTTIARSIIDLNRAEDDRRTDGVVKTHTCWNVPVYKEPLPPTVIDDLLDRYYRPYHNRLAENGSDKTFLLAIDCHTMAAIGPPIGPDTGVERPWICLGYADGTCPRHWIECFQAIFQRALEGPVTINDPFAGGYITRHHSAEMPWLQLEISRRPFMTNSDKRHLVGAAIEELVRTIGR